MKISELHNCTVFCLSLVVYGAYYLTFYSSQTRQRICKTCTCLVLSSLHSLSLVLLCMFIVFLFISLRITMTVDTQNNVAPYITISQLFPLSCSSFFLNMYVRQRHICLHVWLHNVGTVTFHQTRQPRRSVGTFFLPSPPPPLPLALIRGGRFRVGCDRGKDNCTMCPPQEEDDFKDLVPATHLSSM